MHLPAVTAKIKAETLSIAGISVEATIKIKETAVSFLQNILSPRRKKPPVMATSSQHPKT